MHGFQIVRVVINSVFVQAIFLAAASLLLFAISFPLLNSLFFGAFIEHYRSHAPDSPTVAGIVTTSVIRVRMQDGPIDLIVEPLFVLLPLLLCLVVYFAKVPLQKYGRIAVPVFCFLCAAIYLPVASLLSMKFESPESFTPMGPGAWFLTYFCNPIVFPLVVILLFGCASLLLFLRRRRDTN